MLHRLKATGVRSVRGDTCTDKSTAAFKPSNSAEPSSPFKVFKAGAERERKASLEGHLIAMNVNHANVEAAEYPRSHGFEKAFCFSRERCIILWAREG